MAGLFAKEMEPGSALIAAGKLHGSAYVHAIRYGEKGSKAYRQAYSQHVGRFLSALRQVSKAGPDDELRDAQGRWARAMEAAGAKLHGTTGTVGLSRDQVVSKVRGLLDTAAGHTGETPRIASYTGALIGRAMQATGGLAGVPDEVANQAYHHVKHATAHVVSKVLHHPAWRRLATAAVLKKGEISKALTSDEADGLKGIVAGVIADTRLHPRVGYDDAALGAVARGAYRHCHDRLCALKAAMN